VVDTTVFEYCDLQVHQSAVNDSRYSTCLLYCKSVEENF